MPLKEYECTNEACTLGDPYNPGRFSGGITKEQVTMRTGNPEPKDYGNGFCPNCGEKGKEVDGS